MLAKSVLLSRAQLLWKDSLDRLRIKELGFNLPVFIVQDVSSKARSSVDFLGSVHASPLLVVPLYLLEGSLLRPIQPLQVEHSCHHNSGITFYLHQNLSCSKSITRVKESDCYAYRCDSSLFSIYISGYSLEILKHASGTP